MRPFKYSMEYGVKDTAELNTSALAQAGTLADETVANIPADVNTYVNVSAVTNFGARFARFARTHVTQNLSLLTLLRDVTNNFPLFLPEIARQKEDLAGYKIVQSVSSTQQITTLNGRLVPMRNLDIYTFLDIVEEELTLTEMLDSHHRIPAEKIQKFLTKRFLRDTHYLLNCTSPLIVWLNDIEHDPQYASWSDRIEALFVRRGYPHFRKNLVNLVLHGDPSTSIGLTGLFGMAVLVDNHLPVRVGLLPHFDLAKKLSRNVAYAFHYLAEQNHSQAMRFLLGAVSYAGIDETTHVLNNVTEEHFAGAYTNLTAGRGLLGWSEIHTLFDLDSPTTIRIVETQKAIAEMKITTDTILVNGHATDPYRGIGGLYYEVQGMLRAIQHCVMEANLTTLAGKDVFDILSSSYIITPSLDSTVLDERPIGLGLIHKSRSEQTEFLNFLGSMQWNFTDEGRISAYYILFSRNPEEIELVQAFAKGKHTLPSVFAINPPVSPRITRLYRIDLSRTTLIADGRLFHSFTIERLRLIDVWASKLVYGELSSVLDVLPYKRINAVFYVSSVVMDWKAESIARFAVSDDIWEYPGPLVHNLGKEGMHWDLFVDPFTRDFQRIADIVDYVSRNNVTDVRLIALAPATLSDPPQTYYRNALTSERVVFTHLNDTTTYSAMPDMPDAWIVESMRAAIDLDNILLSELSPGVHEGTYVLTNVKAEGTCEVSDTSWAEGTELALFDARGTRKSDTIVMRSAGYWQLAASPGEWAISLGGQNSKVIYQDFAHMIVVASFSARSIRLTIDFNSGMEGLKVYNLSVHDTSNCTTVNVFSVASGHLYERLLKIMMLAVRRKSVFNVKFWIIKAFLSPQFKATLPVMAAKYNFSYQLVSYKWPTWLRPQYEKQRIIWGNKILFLDVLFPLELDRVVYIDSDQVVRTDLIELMRMDFEGAPYAFTPFCDSRRETEPFRFWKHGYWKDHLGDLRYHISALFAIDLPKFRQLAAGDWLRWHYQQLSADRGSLSNLDQDLPNYAQMHIPIFSLPQDWLWCETWCDDESMARAKTIDLCNNPLTKAPKLHIAQTRIREWPGLDEEVRNISAGPDEYQKFFFNE
jgi:UDP-glucose:glycoprotein glucosyltransferase